MKNISTLDLLYKGLQSLNHEVSPAIQDKLIGYIQLLSKWNRRYNLTAIRSLDEMVSYHLLDSLSISAYIKGNRVIDVGTGAGLPGIPLALTMPEKTFTLIDSNGKKTRFLTHICQELAISNAKVVHDRVERFSPDSCFESIISRAFASICDMLDYTNHLCCDDGVFLAMKGRYADEEINKISSQYQLTNVVKLNVPNLGAQRHLIIIAKKQRSYL